jgi:DNA-directed RNA polymerase specialized sigma24 family protein
LTANPDDGQQDFRDFAMARASQLFRIAFLMGGDWHEAEDLVQSTLTKLFVAFRPAAGRARARSQIGMGRRHRRCQRPAVRRSA